MGFRRFRRRNALGSLAFLAWLATFREHLFIGVGPYKDWRRPNGRLGCQGQSEDVSALSVRDLKQFLDECNVRHSDCFEKKELVDRVRAQQAASVQPEKVQAQGRGIFDENKLSSMSARELKAKIVEAGGSVAGCVFKEDYLDRARQIFLTGGSTGQDPGKKSYE